MSIEKNINISIDPWDGLKKFTSARIAIGRTGVAAPLKEVLDFRLCHAHARDAVYSVLKIDELVKSLQQFKLPVITVSSEAKDRAVYLQRPDYGRRLNEVSWDKLREYNIKIPDVAIIIADGLSATAINEHSVPLLEKLISLLKRTGTIIAPLIIAQQARVALADEIGFLLNAKLSLILIGERPGLSSPDSMGAYITYQPSPGLTDESRSCISNIRPEGLTYNLAAEKLALLINASMQLKLSGILLKEDMLQLPDGR